MTQQFYCRLFTLDDENLRPHENWYTNVHKQPYLLEAQIGNSSDVLQRVKE